MNQNMSPSLIRIRLKPRLAMALHRFALPLLALMLLSPSFSFSDVYRCVSDTGIVTYSDTPCGKNAVVAFEEHKMGVEDAARRSIIMPATNRTDKDEIINSLVVHAEKIGSCIFPDKELKGSFLSKTGPSYSKNDLSHSVVMNFRSEDSKTDHVIKVFYEGRMADGPTVKLKTIKVYKNYKPFNPISMKDLKAFRKIDSGVWEYKN